jgi:alanine racemase
VAAPLRTARIDAAALARNAASSGHLAPADISADGFGLGGTLVARIAHDAGFATLHADGLDEALRLRATGVTGALSTDLIPSWRATEARDASITLLEPGLRAVRDPLYGFDSAAESVLRLSAQVLSVKSIASGDGVSYGYTFRATRAGRTALVAIGYGDGVHRRAGNRSSVHLAGAPRPIIGRVAMNVFVVWLGDDSVAIGDEAVLFGDARVGEPSLQEWAEVIGEHPATVTSILGPRVIRSLR